MTNAELIVKIKAEIERLKAENIARSKSYKREDEVAEHYYYGKAFALGELLSFLDTLEEPVCDDLEEAAENYASDFLADRPDQMIAKASFIAGAKWQKQHDAELIEIAYNDGITIGMTKQKEQMLKEAVNGFIFQSADYYPKQLIAGYDGELGMGDKVRIIIVKEDEKWLS